MKGRFLLLVRHVYFENGVKKLNLLAFCTMLAFALSKFFATPLKLLFSFISFLVFYSAVYFYNDLIDLERDRKRRRIPEHKLLARGKFTKKEYATLFFLSLFSGGIATFFTDTLLFIFSLFLVLLNILRTRYFTSLFARSVSLFFITFANLVAFWYAVSGSVACASIYPLFLLYSLVYTLGYCFCKAEKNEIRKHAFLSIPLFFLGLCLSLPVFLRTRIFAVLFFTSLLGVAAYFWYRDNAIGRYLVINSITAFLLVSSLLFFSYPVISEKVPKVSVGPEITAHLQTVSEISEEIIDLAERNVSRYSAVLESVKNLKTVFPGF